MQGQEIHRRTLLALPCLEIWQPNSTAQMKIQNHSHTWVTGTTTRHLWLHFISISALTPAISLASCLSILAWHSITCTKTGQKKPSWSWWYENTQQCKKQPQLVINSFTCHFPCLRSENDYKFANREEGVTKIMPEIVASKYCDHRSDDLAIIALPRLGLSLHFCKLLLTLMLFRDQNDLFSDKGSWDLRCEDKTLTERTISIKKTHTTNLCLWPKWHSVS